MTYLSIKIPDQFIFENVDPFLGPILGFSSRAHFVTEAIREYAEKQKLLLKEKITSKKSQKKVPEVLQ